MYIVLEIDNSSMIVAREFPLLTQESVEIFTEQTNIPLKKEWLNNEKFEQHLFSQLQENENEEVSYMVLPVTVH